jgi:hypothetical protein
MNLSKLWLPWKPRFVSLEKHSKFMYTGTLGFRYVYQRIFIVLYTRLKHRYAMLWLYSCSYSLPHTRLLRPLMGDRRVASDFLPI